MSDQNTPDNGLPSEEVSAGSTPAAAITDSSLSGLQTDKGYKDGTPVVEFGGLEQVSVTPDTSAVADTDSDTSGEEVLQAVPVQSYKDSKTVRQDFDENKAGSRAINGTLDPTQPTMPLPAATSAVVNANLEHPSAKPTTEKQAVWINVVTQGEISRTRDEVFVDSVERPGSDWNQGLPVENNGRVGYYSPKFTDKGDQKLAGDNAIVRMRALLGMGGLVSIPLYHSGFHLTLKTPKDSDFLNLKEINERARITLGRQTFGMIYSSTSGYLVENIMNMVRDHMYMTTLNAPAEEILSRISVLDLQILVWGLACAIWPNGFQYVRADMLGEDQLTSDLIMGRIDVPKLLWVDQSGFTARQKAHLSHRQQNQVTKDAQDLFKSEFVSNAGRTIVLKEDVITMKLRVPSIKDYIDSTHRWIDSLTDILDRTFTGDRTDVEARNQAMMDHANLSRMRQNAHWVESITMEGVEYSTREEVEGMLDVLSENKELRDLYFTATKKFINDSTMAVIAIPETSGRETNLPRFPHLIPIDAVGTFFTLLVRRTEQNLMEAS